ncbi:flagellar basal body P-ring formation chaperone FlgA [Trinickia diaoshuihuensis]|uniref:flagellar basal body P-ring formation chaperone FlgA n=1 Tax=Trinickia diaoshuihuensis TaxID=2292265 RepID=UPI000E253F35|nr:flagellar basal body P-ring formation chaperone FlgA [Trinickia diaoshuihuensis]
MSVSAVSDPARRLGPRALGQRHARLARAAAGLLLAAAFAPFGAAQAQSAGASGQIYIPGPGESHASAPSGTMISIPGPGEARAPAAAATAGAATAGAAPNGMIVIPGAGEANAAAAPPSVPALPRAAAQPRPSTMPAAGQAMPVVVTAPQRAIRSVQPIAVEQPAKPANTRLNAAVANPSASAGAATQPPAAQTAAVVEPASNAPAGQEDGETIRRAALAFLQQQTVGLPGKINITVAPSFPRGLAACTTLEPFMPTGARLWGTTSVGVRCAGAKPWTLYLQARIAIEATYYLAARQIDPGSVITAQDLLARNGDLSNLPRAIVTDPSQAVGSTAIVRIGAGTPLRQDLLKSASAVTIGQTVKVVAQGAGFSISSEGSVMNNASPGQQVRVKMAGGQIISGTVVDGATVQVQM